VTADEPTSTDTPATTAPSTTTATVTGRKATPAPVVEFTWTTTFDTDGYGYVLTVEGTVGDDEAAYTMQVEPLFGTDGGDYSDLIALIAAAAVNGFAGPGEASIDAGGSGGAIAVDGSTVVRVIGDDRWYRNPWLHDEAAFAMGDAEWVHVAGDDRPMIDVASYVVAERHDEAVRTVLAQIAAGEDIDAPAPSPGTTELDEILTPWIGLTESDGFGTATATVTGDDREGSLRWELLLTYEPDGSDGRIAGEVTWRPGASSPVDAPDPGLVIEATALAPQLR